VLVIAHRLSTLVHMDRIVQVDAGVIVRDGHPSEFADVVAQEMK
jgi:ABC-type multidrug transport system fused ATPase/permease subunit